MNSIEHSNAMAIIFLTTFATMLHLDCMCTYERPGNS